MIAKDLYQKLETDFKLSECKDDWSNISFNGEFVTENFRKRYMGILADNTKNIQKVYTAVFLSEKVMKEILERGEKDVLLFTHHPIDWKIIPGQSPFISPNDSLLKQFKGNRISIYTLHTPLDRNGEYSTSVNFSKILGIEKIGDCCQYFGFPAGIIGKTELGTVAELAKRLESVIGHKTKIWDFGEKEIRNGKVVVVAGGGNDPEILEETAKLGINTLVTGVVFPNKYYEPALRAHEIAKKEKISLIGGTHYSTEKFACMKMCEYFEKLGIPAEFLEDIPDMNDLE